MIVNILFNTPLWVYALFLVLVVVGGLQARTRTVRKAPALLLPLVMMAFSLTGLHSNFGFRPVPLTAWGVALAASTLVGYAVFRNSGLHYRPSEGRFYIPGSWMPVTVMLAIFFAKYAYAVLNAFDTPMLKTPLFTAMMAALYGLFSGYFAARAAHLIRQVQTA